LRFSESRRQGKAAALPINRHDLDREAVADVDDLVRVGDALLGDLADVDEASTPSPIRAKAP
jgi:hypothetical protein